MYCRFGTVVLLLLAVSHSAAAEQAEGPSIISRTVELDGRSIRVSTSSVPGEVVVVERDREPLRIPLPDDAGMITELHAGRWFVREVPALVVAAETTSKDHGAVSYYWLTLRADDKGGWTVQGVARFQTGTTDFDLIGVHSAAGLGDSIYITLMDVPFTSPHKPTGLLFVHHCPVHGGIPGMLYELNGELKGMAPPEQIAPKNPNR